MFNTTCHPARLCHMVTTLTGFNCLLMMLSLKIKQKKDGRKKNKSCCQLDRKEIIVLVDE